MRVVAIGDVGVTDDMIHIGDEAMFDEFVTRMRARGISDVTAVSAAPAETAARYAVDATVNIGFSPSVVASRQKQVERLAHVLEAADLFGTAGRRSRLPANDPAWAVIEAIAGADGVAVTGGGNMASIWPMHIFERRAIAGVAQRFGKPLVVTGQTIGPELDDADRDLVASLLSAAKLVGLRERDSYDLVRQLGIGAASTAATIDDASFLGIDGAASRGSSWSGGRPPYVAVTLASHTGGIDQNEFAAAAAGLLDRIADETGLTIVFHAHFASLRPDDERGDSLVHRRVLDRLTTAARIEPTTDARASADFARRASLVVSSRYHPAVFAVACGVPTVGIAVDDYTSVKLTGALGNLGQNGVVTASQVVDGTAAEKVFTTIARSGRIRDEWEARIDSVRAGSDAWWDRVAAALGA